MSILSKIPISICSALLLWAYYENLSCIVSYRYSVAHQTSKAIWLSILLHWLWLSSVSCLFITYFRGPGIVSEEGAREEKFYAYPEDNSSAINMRLSASDSARSRTNSFTSSLNSSSSRDDEEETILQDDDDAPLAKLAGEASPYVGLMSREQRKEILQQPLDSMTMKANGGKRFCRKCQISKPDRAHHCSSCKACALRMDHHCGIIGCCVGFANYKSFFLFLCYTTLFCLFSCLNALFTLIDFVQVVPDGFELSPIGWALLLMLGGAIALVLGGFTAFHFYLILQNKTTIENMESTRIRLDHTEHDYYRLTSDQRRQLRKANAKYHIYDLGWKENLAAVFRSLYGWKGIFFPLDAPRLEEGYSFKVNERHLENVRNLNQEIRSRNAEN